MQSKVELSFRRWAHTGQELPADRDEGVGHGPAVAHKVRLGMSLGMAEEPQVTCHQHLWSSGMSRGLQAAAQWAPCSATSVVPVDT